MSCAFHDHATGTLPSTGNAGLVGSIATGVGVVGVGVGGVLVLAGRRRRRALT